MRIVRCALNLLAVTAITAGVAPATVLYNNIGTTVRGYGRVESYGGLYNSFSTGSTPQTLTDVQLKLKLLAGADTSVTVTLYANNGSLYPVDGNSPGDALLTIGTIGDSQVSTSGGTYDFPVNPGYSLAANTRYWIGVTPNPSNLGWGWNYQEDSGGATAGEYHCYAENYDEDAGACLANGDDPFLMMVTGQPQTVSVPAVSSVALVSLGVLLMAFPLWVLRRKYYLPT